LLAVSAGTLLVSPRTEAAGLAAAAFPENAAIIALDASWRGFVQPDLAGRLGRWRDRGTPANISDK